MSPSTPPETASHRYLLTRDLRSLLVPTPRRVLFCMLNPSTATAHEDDQSVRKVIVFTRRQSGTELAIVNLCAARATNPADLRKLDDPVGADNDLVIEQEARSADLIIAAWGVPPKGVPDGRADHVLELLTRHGDVYRLAKPTRGGHPRHPLYLPGSTKLELHTRRRRTPPGTRAT